MKKQHYIYRIIFISDYFRSLYRYIRFGIVVCIRFLYCFFKWNKKIKLIDIQYSTKFQFQKSYITINYKFNNALWYAFSPLCITTVGNSISFDSEKIHADSVVLKVIGLFSVKRYLLSIAPENRLMSTSFKKQFAIKNINHLATDFSLRTTTPQPMCKSIRFKTPNRLQLNKPNSIQPILILKIPSLIIKLKNHERF